MPLDYSRERIAADHRVLDEVLHEVAEVAEAMIRGSVELEPLLDRQLRALSAMILQHHALESQALLPELNRGNGWGAILARHLGEVHRHQLALLEDAAGVEDAIGRAVKVRVMTHALRDDLLQEARWLDQLA